MHALEPPIRQDLLADLPDTSHTELLRHAVSTWDPPISRRIFVNRAVRMETIRHVGFDLDWTLAPYRRLPIEELAFRLTIERLVERHGYPEIIRQAEFRPDFPRRGVLVDKEEGTVIKMNRHRYVGRAYLGRRPLDPDERSDLYRGVSIQPSSPRFYHVDTLFELPEVNIFTEIVDMAIRDPEALPIERYEALFQDVRNAIDSVHGDGTLKSHILASTETYLAKDPEIALALKRLALGRRRIILITNSEWYYSRALLEHLFDNALPDLESWKELFDLVIVLSKKPGFFREKRPFIEIDEEGRELGETEVPEWGRIYQGGCRKGLMELLGCKGDQVLYVGDHIYGDILAPKLRSSWRTALVIRELEDELDIRGQLQPIITRRASLKVELAELGRRMDDVRDVLTLRKELSRAGIEVPRALIAEAAERKKLLEREHRALRMRSAAHQQRVSAAYNGYWGSLFKQGGNKSLFASQVEDFACMYTSRASNFGFYGTNHYYRVLGDPMMHELQEE